MTQANNIARKHKRMLRKKFFHGVSISTESVFLPETFSTKYVAPVYVRFADFMISFYRALVAQMCINVFCLRFQLSM